MKIWFDKNTEPTTAYTHIVTVDSLDKFIKTFEARINRLKKLCDENPLSKVTIPEIEHISISSIEALEWMKENNKDYPIHIHTLDPSIVVDIKRMIKENGWKEVW